MGFFDSIAKIGSAVTGPLGTIIGGAFGGVPGAIIGSGAGSAVGNVLGGLNNKDDTPSQGWLAAKNMEMQKEFAQHGIRWKVEDAKAAGLHPLYALGANTQSFSPIQVGSSGGNSPDLAGMGQDISRAMMAGMTEKERQDINIRMTERDAMFDKQRFENGELQNQLLAAQIAKVNQSLGPSIPSLPSNSDMPLLTGQGNSRRTAKGGAYVNENPLERVHSQPGRPAQEVGSVPDYGYVRTPTGYAIVPSQDVKNKIEDQFIPETMWAIRNQILPAVKGLPAPDPRYFKPPKGFNDWKWNPWAQEFQPAINGRIPGIQGPKALRKLDKKGYFAGPKAWGG